MTTEDLPLAAAAAPHPDIGPPTVAQQRSQRALAEGHTHVADEDPAEVDDNFISRNPVRVGMISILAVTLAFRWAVLKDGYFITDDFMLTTRALENDFGWNYLTRVHTGHFEPIGFAVIWVLSRLAPLNWNVNVAVLIAAQAAVAVLVWRLLCTLFTRRALVLVPFAVYCLTPLTIPAYTWLSAAIIWLPLAASVAGALRQHVLYVRTGQWKHAVGATAWLLLGAASFEKFLVYGPFVVVFTLALHPNVRLSIRTVVQIFRRTWMVWTGYAVVAALYAVIYLRLSAQSDVPSDILTPTLGQLSDFTYLSVLRNFVPVAFGGPWKWSVLGHSTGLPDSAPAFDWLFWALGAGLILASLLIRRRIGRAWLALAVYLAGSMATLAVSRVPITGSITGLETRYLADAAVPFVVVIGMCLMPLVGEKKPWSTLPAYLDSPVVRRTALGLFIVVGLSFFALSLHSFNGYARIQGGNPHRAFTERVKSELATLPKDAQVYDTVLPRDVMGAWFGDYNTVSRFLSPMASPAQRRDMYSRTAYTNPYILTAEGAFVPMAVEGASSVAAKPATCAFASENGRIEIPLSSDVFDWSWAVRIGYLSDSDTSATLSLGRGAVPVQLRKGLGQVVVRIEGGGSALVVQDLHPWAKVCVGDAQVGNPVPK